MTGIFRFENLTLNANRSPMPFISLQEAQKLTNVKRHIKSKKKLKTDCMINERYSISENRLEIDFPLVTVSEGNCFEPWQKKNTRHKKQKELAGNILKPYLSKINLPCKITLIRYGPRFLDAHDNLRMAFKFFLDGLCDAIIPGLKPGKADGDSRLSFDYDQVKSKAKGVKILFEF